MNGPLYKMYACIGDPVVGNPSEWMMQKAFDKAGFAGRYLTITVKKEELEDATRALKALGFAGFNVTAPHKIAIIPYLDGISEAAKLSGAVNCVSRSADGFIGDNTDGKGFMRALSREIGSVEGKTFHIFGSGGAAGAIASELVLANARRIVVSNRTEQKSRELCERLDGVRDTIVELGGWRVRRDEDVVIQATTVGLFDPDSSIDVEFEPRENVLWASDVVFNPTDTKFLKKARAFGAKTIDGLGMLVAQGAIAVEKWSGKEADEGVMREALEEAFRAG